MLHKWGMTFPFSSHHKACMVRCHLWVFIYCRCWQLPVLTTQLFQCELRQIHASYTTVFTESGHQSTSAPFLMHMSNNMAIILCEFVHPMPWPLLSEYELNITLAWWSSYCVLSYEYCEALWILCQALWYVLDWLWPLDARPYHIPCGCAVKVKPLLCSLLLHLLLIS